MIITIGGDVCVVDANREMFHQKKTKELFNDVSAVMSDSDFCIVNLTPDKFKNMFPNAFIKGVFFPVFQLYNHEFAKKNFLASSVARNLESLIKKII